VHKMVNPVTECGKGEDDFLAAGNGDSYNATTSPDRKWMEGTYHPPGWWRPWFRLPRRPAYSRSNCNEGRRKPQLREW